MTRHREGARAPATQTDRIPGNGRANCRQTTFFQTELVMSERLGNQEGNQMDSLWGPSNAQDVTFLNSFRRNRVHGDHECALLPALTPRPVEGVRFPDITPPL